MIGQMMIKWDDAAKKLSLEPASKQSASRARSRLNLFLMA